MSDTPNLPTLINQVEAWNAEDDSAVSIEGRVLRLIAKSPASKAACEIINSLEELNAHGIEVQAVFMKIPSRGPGSAVLEKLAHVYGSEVAYQNVRIATFHGASALVEQVNFGRVGFWTGNKLKSIRSRKLGDGEYFDTSEDSNMADVARAGFVSSWNMSTRVDRRRVGRPETTRALPQLSQV